VRLQGTVRLVRFLSSTGPLTTFESLGNSLSANDLRLTVQLPTDAPGTPSQSWVRAGTSGNRHQGLASMQDPT
jgi:hypothetical protein